MVLVLAHLASAFNARSETTVAFAHLFSNPWLWGAIARSLLLQVAVVNLDFVNLAFGTAPLAFDQWLLCAAMASMVLWCRELRKLGFAHGAEESTPKVRSQLTRPARTRRAPAHRPHPVRRR